MTSKEEQQNEGRSYFTFFRSFQEAIDQCEESDQLALYRGIVSYALDEIEPTFNNPLLKVCWTLIRPNLHIGWVRTKNGRKGRGIPKPSMIGNTNAKKENNQSKNKANSNQKQTKNKTIGKDRIKDRIGIGIDKEGEVASLFPPTHSDRFIKFVEFLEKNCPHLRQMEQPTEEQFNKMLEKAGDAKRLSELLLNMENSKDTPKKRRSIYRTAINWLNMESKK